MSNKYFPRWQSFDLLEFSAPDCLAKLANLIEDRKYAWNYPPAAEEDDERPDYPEIRERRFHFVFQRPLEEDLEAARFDRVRVWLQLNAPRVVDDVLQRIESLSSRIPLQWGDTEEDLITEMAEVAYYLMTVAKELEASGETKVDETRQETSEKDNLTGHQNLAALSDKAMMNHRDFAEKLGVEAESLRKRLDRWRKDNGDGWQELTEPRAREPRYLYRVGAVRDVLQAAINAQ